MKLIKAIIRREKFDEVKAPLDCLGHGSMTATDVEGRGNQKRVRQEWRGAECIVNSLSKQKLELVVSDNAAEQVIATIMEAARTENR